MAVEKAMKGKAVTVISSGDAGVYGSGDPNVRSSKRDGLETGGSQHQIVFGITAINACLIGRCPSAMIPADLFVRPSHSWELIESV